MHLFSGQLTEDILERSFGPFHFQKNSIIFAAKAENIFTGINSFDRLEVEAHQVIGNFFAGYDAFDPGHLSDFREEAIEFVFNFDGDSSFALEGGPELGGSAIGDDFPSRFRKA